jgi:ribosomal protein S18 acetylase RimI-like enzyme
VTGVTIRRAQTSDAPAMAELYIAAAREGWSHIYPADALAQLRAPEARMVEEIEDTSARRSVLVAVLDSEVVGFAVTRPSHDEDESSESIGELDTFYSHPRVWGRGVGRALMREALAALRASGFTEATLWTAEENHRPRAVYEAAGWRTDGAVKENTHLGVSVTELRHRIALV